MRSVSSVVEGRGVGAVGDDLLTDAVRVADVAGYVVGKLVSIEGKDILV